MMIVPKKPKPRDASKTKAKILSAAQKAFSELGYSQAGIRDIAAIADVSSTMLLRYYGSKAALFEAALIDAMPLETMLDQGKDRFGERLAAVFLDTGLNVLPPSIISLSTGDAEARDIATRVLNEYIVVPLAVWLGPPDAQVRAVEITLLAMGFVLHTRQIPLMSSQKNVKTKLAKWFGQTVQAIVDQC